MAQINRDEIRKKFEERFKESLFPLIKFDRTLRGTYANDTLQNMWEGFYACAEIYEKENAELKTGLGVAGEFINRNDTLTAQLAIAIEALEKYSEVSRVRVTKCNDGSQWRQTDEYTAKDALVQIKDVKDPEVEANRQWIKNQLTERKDVK